MGYVLVVILGILALAGVAALINGVGKESAHGRKRATWLGVALVLAVLIGVGMLSYATGYYVMPAGWIVALVVAGLVVVGLFILLASEARWQLLRLLGLLGLVLLAAILFAAIAMLGVGGEALHPYRARAQQIAEANYFTVLLPAGYKLSTEGLPVDALAAPDAGLVLDYGAFVIQERLAPGPMSPAYLKEAVAPGKVLLPGAPVPEGARVTPLSVRGWPAIAVEYEYVPQEGLEAERTPEEMAVLMFEMDGVEVRLFSFGGQQRDASGNWVPGAPLTAEEMVRIAETLVPAP